LFKLILLIRLKPRSRQLAREELTFVEERGWSLEASVSLEEDERLVAE
jgi:hypothetical protein